jgi:hypothetical protein
MIDTLTIRAQDVFGATSTAQFIIPIVNNLAIVTSSLPNGTQGTPYSTPIVMSGGLPAYSGQVIGNSGANSWSFSGVNLVGTPTVVETAQLTLLMLDSVGVPSAAQFNLQVVAASGGSLTVTVHGGPAPQASVGIPYEQLIDCAGFTGTLTWLKVSGPAWGTVAAGGISAFQTLFSGTPAGISSDTFVIQATDSLSNTGTVSFTI